MPGSRGKEAGWRFRWILLCCLLASVRKWCLVTAELNGEQYVLQRESAVRAIVEQAVLNDKDSCDLLSNCTASPCSRAACNMLLEDNRNYQCVDVSQNLLCPTPSGQGYCNGARVNYKRSYVRLPGSSLSDERISAICTHRMLDKTFEAAFHNSTDGAYYNTYFGTVDGSFRFYPGTEVQDCNNYDPRIRPWYIGAISVLKDLVVLVDVASSMNDKKSGYFNDITTGIAGAQSITEQLLLTLTQGDRATVLSYSTRSTANLLGQLVVRDQVDARSDPIFQQIQNLTVNASANVSNLTTGISQALQVFNNGSAVEALKIVLVLTNGQSPASSEELYPLLQQLNDSNIALFVYEIEDTDPTLAAVACQVKHGHVETVDISSLQNPLFAIKSYFTFLAQSRNLATPHQFWQLPYNDSNFRGEVITVAYPAISKDGELIGVAGLDMQVGLITKALKHKIEDFLRKNRNPGSPLTYPVGAPSVSPCPTVETGTKLCNSVAADATPVCKQTDIDHNYTDLLCCPGCGGVRLSGSRSFPLIKLQWIILVAAGGAVGVGVVAYFLWMWCWGPSRKPIELDTNAPSATRYDSDLSGDTGLQSPGSPGRRI